MGVATGAGRKLGLSHTELTLLTGVQARGDLCAWFAQLGIRQNITITAGLTIHFGPHEHRSVDPIKLAAPEAIAPVGH